LPIRTIPWKNIDSAPWENRRRHLLVVAYTEKGDAIRIVSARKATRSERKVYEEGV